MMNKKKVLLAIALVVLLTGVFTLYKFFGPSVSQPDSKYLFIPTGTDYTSVKKILKEQHVLGGDTWFDWASKMIGYNKVKPGRYEIAKGSSLVNLVRMLRNGSQKPVDFVITKLRTKESLAGRIGRAFECDSLEMLQFLNNPDSLREYGLDTNTAMAAAMPLTYTIRWNTGASGIFGHFYQAYKTFWTDARKQKAAALGLDPKEVITLASIIDEETNAPADKPNVASTYLNRIRIGMPLQADPTVKFALKNFGLRRILKVHTETASPYNTYVNRGLPPGPICTPNESTIDSVLNAPKTEYLYFVANNDLSKKTHIFTTNYADHLKYAHLYQQELDKRNIK
ncbi:MAG: endolytic transglycosylase MltG [Chitinophagaceae bacterium]|nr:MAG: endolytic transglycosylase MltG [Chitinophagaceae bacterium]